MTLPSRRQTCTSVWSPGPATREFPRILSVLWTQGDGRQAPETSAAKPYVLDHPAYVSLYYTPEPERKPRAIRSHRLWRPCYRVISCSDTRTVMVTDRW